MATGNYSRHDRIVIGYDCIDIACHLRMRCKYLKLLGVIFTDRRSPAKMRKKVKQIDK